MNNLALKEVSTDLFCDEKIELLKATICRDATDDEFDLFLHACTRTGLDPFMKQIYAVKRWDNNLGRMSMTMQTGIDGYRLIAERTKKYSPGREPTYTYDQNGKLESATAFVKKMTHDGTWHEVSASAFYSEYVQRKKDGSPLSMWLNMPRNQLAKCAESLALRKCFPAEMSGLYTKEEMAQSEVIDEQKGDTNLEHKKPVTDLVHKESKKVQKIEELKPVTDEMVGMLNELLNKDEVYKEKIEIFVLETFQVTSFKELSFDNFAKIYKDVRKHFKNLEEVNVGTGNTGVDTRLQK